MDWRNFQTPEVVPRNRGAFGSPNDSGVLHNREFWDIVQRRIDDAKRMERWSAPNINRGQLLFDHLRFLLSDSFVENGRARWKYDPHPKLALAAEIWEHLAAEVPSQRLRRASAEDQLMDVYSGASRMACFVVRERLSAGISANEILAGIVAPVLVQKYSTLVFKVIKSSEKITTSSGEVISDQVCWAYVVNPGNENRLRCAEFIAWLGMDIEVDTKAFVMALLAGKSSEEVCVEVARLTRSMKRKTK